MFVPYLLRDGEADDVVSLRDVPCHHSRVRFHCLDGHIDRRRQAICKHRETNASFITCAMRQMRGFSPANPKRKWRCEVNKQLLGVLQQKPQTLSTQSHCRLWSQIAPFTSFLGVKIEANSNCWVKIKIALWSLFNAALKSWKINLKARARAELELVFQITSDCFCSDTTH